MYFGFRDLSDYDVDNQELSQINILCETNINILSSEMKNKKHKKRKKKLKDIIVKCAEVEELKRLILLTIEEKNSETLNKYLSLDGLNNSITKEYLINSLNEAIDDTNNTVLHIASIKCLHDHI